MQAPADKYTAERLAAAQAYSLLLKIRYKSATETCSDNPEFLLENVRFKSGDCLICIGDSIDIRIPIVAAKIYGCRAQIFEKGEDFRSRGVAVAHSERVDHLLTFFPLDRDNTNFLKGALLKGGTDPSLVLHFKMPDMRHLLQFYETSLTLLTLGIRIVTENHHFPKLQVGEGEEVVEQTTSSSAGTNFRFLQLNSNNNYSWMLRFQKTKTKIRNLESSLRESADPTGSQEQKMALGHYQRDLKAMEAAESASNIFQEKFKASGDRRVVGIVLDERMSLHTGLEGRDGSPPLISIATAFETAGLFDRLAKVPARAATLDEVLLVHSKEQVEKITDRFETKEEGTNDRYLGSLKHTKQDTFATSMLSVGGAIDLLNKVVVGECNCGIVVVDPPGHQSGPKFTPGSHFFNSVAVAVKSAIENEPDVKKVLIVDWGNNHGKGTQSIFLDDPSVLYFSIHLKGDPKGAEDPGSFNNIGEGKGIGFNMNVEWSNCDMGNAEYLYAWDNLLIPAARAYNPDLIVVCGGFDSPEGKAGITPEGFAHLLYPLLGLAGGRLVVMMEGGEDVERTCTSGLACANTLLGNIPPRISKMQTPQHSAIEAVHQTINALSSVSKERKRGTDVPSSSAVHLEEIIVEHGPIMVALGSFEKSGNQSYQHEAICRLLSSPGKIEIDHEIHI